MQGKEKDKGKARGLTCYERDPDPLRCCRGLAPVAVLLCPPGRNVWHAFIGVGQTRRSEAAPVAILWGTAHSLPVMQCNVESTCDKLQKAIERECCTRQPVPVVCKWNTRAGTAGSGDHLRLPQQYQLLTWQCCCVTQRPRCEFQSSLGYLSLICYFLFP